MGIVDNGYQQSIIDTHDNWFDTRRLDSMEALAPAAAWCHSEGEGCGSSTDLTFSLKNFLDSCDDWQY